ncbi:hypothetical protein [Caulobacter sp.]|uniref:hypothetical protein n=1 Tax=Caulobacter sp. TaxID=78 RepID=UPI001B204CB9|nr:hypothetical protein [Caulobacter sp.]MBO9545433.1 hypothetical protein [Caulobacter sp.]
MDTPVLTWDPNLNGGQACYCCCSCFALDTPIEARAGVYTLIQDIRSGDEILACGLDLAWRPTSVKYRTGDTEPSTIPGMYYVEYLMAGEAANRHLLVTVDHLFLMHSSKTLKKVQTLVPGDELMMADGQQAIVQFAVVGEHFTAVQSLEMDGRLDPRTLSGHLVNSNGVVTADYAVQVLYEMGDPDNVHHDHHTDDNESEAHVVVGSEDYHHRHANEASKAFHADASRWPKGFKPHHTGEMSIPAMATRYISHAQMKAVRENGSFNPPTNITGRDALLYLFQQSRRLYPDITCILDWNHKQPNAYAWESGGQKFIVFSGGLVRLKGLFMEGLSVILASLQASLQRPACVCEWDYAATASILRSTWPDSILTTLLPAGLQQVEAYFKLAEGAPLDHDGDRCNAPTLDCRIQSYWAGFSFYNLPECAGVYPRYLLIGTAFAAIDNLSVTVAFNDALDPATATDVNNYVFSPAAQVASATIDPKSPKAVVLSTPDLKPDSYYVLVLNNLQSKHGAPLGPEQNKAIITTHP